MAASEKSGAAGVLSTRNDDGGKTVTMRRLPLNATDDEIKLLVAEWSELLAVKKFQEALDMFPSCNEEFP